MVSLSSGTIMIISNDAGAASSWDDILRRGGFRTEHCRNVDDLPTMTEGLYDSVIADSRSPGGGAFSLCRDLERFRCPVTFVGPCEEVDKVVAVEMGADDFIDHGIDGREFLARIRAQIRSCRRSSTARPARDGWTVQPHLRRVTSPSGTSVYLTSSEMRLFSLLSCNAGGHLTSEKLVQTLRLDGDAEGNLRSLMTRLRKKLASAGEDPIRTLYGRGYEFTAPVSDAFHGS